jgi:pantoate--beta-alanine ligase
VTSSRVNSISECRRALESEREAGKRIGFVPTMGHLHRGHLSLIDCARESSDCIVVSVFVNPLQFGPTDDFETYPRDLGRDLELCADRGVDLVFAPAEDEMYAQTPVTRVTMRGVTDGLEGAARRGHFDGVLTIVMKLFQIVQPDVAVFGQKDAQQAAAIRRMVSDLAVPVQILVAPTVREEDGLACSSRNVFLSDPGRESATRLYAALSHARELVSTGERDAGRLEAAMHSMLSSDRRIEVEYAAVVDGRSFQPLELVVPGALAAVAARIGSTRLIDNVWLESDVD